MWRLPLLNFFFVLVLITFLALRHSASVFAPAETAYETSHYDPFKTQASVLSGQSGIGDPLSFRYRIAIGYLSDLWQRSMIIKEWWLENDTASWERIRAARGAATDLVEARFHVANAEVFGAATGEKQRAKVELDRADRYLQKALTDVGDNTQLALEAIRKELTATKMDLETVNPEPQTRDERIKAELDRVINELHGKRR